MKFFKLRLEGHFFDRKLIRTQIEKYFKLNFILLKIIFFMILIGLEYKLYLNF